MTRLIDLTGGKFGRLTVIERAEKNINEAAWRCVCSCGNETIVRGHALRRGQTQSCGCKVGEHMKRRRSRYAPSPVKTDWPELEDLDDLVKW
jgi:hypothetical protein